MCSKSLLSTMERRIVAAVAVAVAAAGTMVVAVVSPAVPLVVLVAVVVLGLGRLVVVAVAPTALLVVEFVAGQLVAVLVDAQLALLADSVIIR